MILAIAKIVFAVPKELEKVRWSLYKLGCRTQCLKMRNEFTPVIERCEEGDFSTITVKSQPGPDILLDKYCGEQNHSSQ